MNLQDYRIKIRKILFDQASPSSSRWSDNDLNEFINDALLEISRAARRRKIGTLNFTSGADRQSLPVDMLKMDGHPLWQKAGDAKRTELVPANSNYPLNDDAGIPEEYWIAEGSIIIRPIPSADGTVTIPYYRRFTDLVNDDDVPEPEKVDRIIVAYGVWQALDWDGNALAEIWKEKFILQLTAWAQAEGALYRNRPRRVKVSRWS